MLRWFHRRACTSLSRLQVGTTAKGASVPEATTAAAGRRKNTSKVAQQICVGWPRHPGLRTAPGIVMFRHVEQGMCLFQARASRGSRAAPAR